MIVQLYIYVDDVAERLELYKDEKISLTQNIINYQDISKVFADYSQSFTIPCSKHNNRVLSHWYENSVNDSFDHRVRYNGFIEIDTLPFKSGSFQLESVSFKDKKPESYKITFFGKVKQLKDLFGDDKLSSLDYSSLNHTYNATEVFNRITSATNYDVRYPLFAHDRLYDFGTGTSFDVTTNAGAIQWNSLFPAIKVPKIMDLIESKYGITFSSIFFDNYNQYKKLWMLLKNKELMVAQSVPLKINFTTKDSGFDAMDLTNDDCWLGQQTWTNTGYVPPNYTGPIPAVFSSIPTTITLQIVTTSTVNYKINYYKNGVLSGASNSYSGTQNISFTELRSPHRYSFEIVSDAPMTFTSYLRISYDAIYVNNVVGSMYSSFFESYEAFSASQTTSSNLNIANYIPDIKVYDFFMGLVKMFNLIIVPKSETEFTIEPLELWYSLGERYEITEFVQTDSVDMKKPSIYKKVDFLYEKSENILNAKFREIFTSIRGFDYGDLSYTSNTDITEAKYEVKLPFENPMYERDNLSTFQTTTFKKMDLNNYVPKPVLMYENGLTTSKNSAGTTTSMKYYNGSTYQNFNGYQRFSNELNIIPTDETNVLSLNFNEEISSWSLNAVTEGLYTRLYDNFIENLYNIKSRIVNLKCKLTSKKLFELKMNDRIFIEDKRYVINNVTTDLTTGECDFELMTDFRPTPYGMIQFAGTTIGFRMSNIQNINITKDALDTDIVVFKGAYEQFDYLASVNGLLSYTLKTGVTDNDAFNLTMTANTSGVERTDSVVIKYYLNGDIYYYFINIIQAG